MSLATIGKRFQVVIPLNVRRQLKIKPHSKVEIVVEGNKLVIYPLSVSSLKGIGRATKDDTDPTDYIATLRSEWERGF